MLFCLLDNGGPPERPLVDAAALNPDGRATVLHPLGSPSRWNAWTRTIPLVGSIPAEYLCFDPLGKASMGGCACSGQVDFG